MELIEQESIPSSSSGCDLVCGPWSSFAHMAVTTQLRHTRSVQLEAVDTSPRRRLWVCHILKLT